MEKLRLLNSLAFRNLIRQRRRNLLLGVAIAFGTMILILANSFSRGITDTLLNKIVVQMTGHLELAVLERSRAQNLLIRDRQKYLDLLQKNLPGIREVADNVAVFSRAIGNGKGENVIVIPMDFGDGKNLAQNIDAEYLTSRALEGNLEDMLSAKYENPVAIFADKSRALNVKLFDTVKVRLKTVAGQEQSARFTIVMQLKSESLFESGALFLPLKNLKELRGIRANETGSLQVTFKNFDSPRAVIRMADQIHGLLKPGIAGIYGDLSQGKKSTQVVVAGLVQEFGKSDTVKKSLTLVAGEFPKDKDTDRILIADSVAQQFNLKKDAKVTLRFKSIHAAEPVEQVFVVAGIFRGATPETIAAFLPEAGFYKTWLGDLPEKHLLPQEKIPEEWRKLLAPEFRLLPRTATGDDLIKKNQELRKTGFYGPAIDVRTMYESASQVLELEGALNLITLIAVLILFFIILIGVVNTLRMTIRERTREIGTMRAIGVRSGDVRNIFLLETFQLAFFSAVAGLILAFIAMLLLSSFTIDTQSVLGIFLSKKRLYFVPFASDIVRNVFMILMISTVTAYFPSRRAAKLDAAEALRHYE
ncbi:MAG: ABC transporter permease [Spirochaetes bacterium]|nr:ABC transporter permease [Spirochaetota bacterium]